jgi:hypothetical protein
MNGWWLVTKPYKVHITCSHCGHRIPAETAFGQWMRDQSKLKSGDGIVRTDCDHIIVRYKTHPQGRDFQLMMIVEVKEFGGEPDPCQRDILSFLSQTIFIRSRQICGAKTTKSLKLKSHILGRPVLVRNYGVHLLQFEKTSPRDSAWIKWDRCLVDAPTLTEILAFERRPDAPHLWMKDFLRDRHRQSEMPLFHRAE